MLFLNKLLPIFCLPLGWTVLLLLFALWRRRWWPVVVGVLTLVVASMPAVGNRLLGSLESPFPPQRIAEAGPADAIVVLGGIFGGPRLPEGYVPNLAESAERLEAGILLQQAHRAEWLVFTGGRIPWQNRVVVEGEDARAVALARGVPAAKILVTREVGNTWDEARAVADLARERGWKKIILVTTAWHLPRATRLFRAARVEFAPFPVDYRVDPAHPASVLDFLPRADGLAATETALREYYGAAFYALTGR